MIFDHKKMTASQLVLLAMLGLGLLCIVIALFLKLDALYEDEKVPLEQLLQQHWQEQLGEGAQDNNKEDVLLLSNVENAEAPTDEVTKDVQDGSEVKSENGSEAVGGAESNVESEDEADMAVEAANNSAEAQRDTPPSDSGKIDINTATAQQLQQLKGIGPSKAEAIVADREKKGKFNRIEDIKRVKGIGEKLFAGIQESIVASP